VIPRMFCSGDTPYVLFGGCPVSLLCVFSSYFPRDFAIFFVFPSRFVHIRETYARHCCSSCCSSVFSTYFHSISGHFLGIFFVISPFSSYFLRDLYTSARHPRDVRETYARHPRDVRETYARHPPYLRFWGPKNENFEISSQRRKTKTG